MANWQTFIQGLHNFCGITDWKTVDYLGYMVFLGVKNNDNVLQTEKTVTTTHDKFVVVDFVNHSNPNPIHI